MLKGFYVSAVAISSIFTGCSRLTDAQLFGAWRAEDEGAVTELAFRTDHTFASWDTSKTEFSTPSTIVQTGVWKLHGDQLELDYKTANFPQNRKHTTIIIEGNGADRFVVKTPETTEPFSLVRLTVPECGSSIGTPSQVVRLADDQIFGTWKIHYNTHDYEHSFNQNHTFTISARLNGVLEEFGRGGWRIEGNRLIMRADSKKGEPREKEFFWIVTHLEQRCFAIMDGPVPYALQRLP